MKNIRRITAILLVSVLVASMFLTSCVKKDNTAETSVIEESSVPEESSKAESSKAESSKAESSKAESSVEESSEEESQIPVPEGNMNLLTGLYDISDDAVGMRPVSIVINNHINSLPQYGISGADVIMEMIAEYGITRFLAIYSDNTVIPNVCSVRSARPYLVEFAAGFDSVFVHAGGSAEGLQMIDTLGVAHFDGRYGDYNIFDRDPNRLPYYALEHTLYCKGENLWWEIPNYGFREELDEAHSTPWFNFRLPEDYQSNTDDKAVTIDIHFCDDYFTTLNYNEEDHKYYKLHSGEPQIDQVSGEQLAFTNVLILQSDEYYSADSRNHIDTMGGTGYYASNGTYEEIKWSRDSEYDRIAVTTPDGKEITMNAGKFYVGVVDYAIPITFE